MEVWEKVWKEFTTRFGTDIEVWSGNYRNRERERKRSGQVRKARGIGHQMIKFGVRGGVLEEWE